MASTTTISVHDETGAPHPDWTAGPVQLSIGVLHTVVTDDHRVILVGGPTDASPWGEEVPTGELGAVILGSNGSELSSATGLVGAAEAALGIGLRSSSVRRVLEHASGAFTIVASVDLDAPVRVSADTGLEADAGGVLLIRLDGACNPIDTFGRGGYRLITNTDLEDGELLVGAVCADADDLLLGVMNEDTLWTSLIRLDPSGVQTGFSSTTWSAARSWNLGSDEGFPNPYPGWGNGLELLSSPTDFLDDYYYLTGGSGPALAAAYTPSGAGEKVAPNRWGQGSKRFKASLHDWHFSSVVGRLGWLGSGVYVSTSRDDILNYGQGSTVNADDFEGWYTDLDWSSGGSWFSTEGFRTIRTGTWRAAGSGWLLADLRIEDDVVHVLTAEGSDKYFTDSTIRWTRLDRANGHSELGSADLVPLQPVGFRGLRYLQAVLARDLSRALVGTVEVT